MQFSAADIITTISLWLDWQSLLKFRRTCHRLYKLFDQNFWKTKLTSEFKLTENSYPCLMFAYLAHRKLFLKEWLNKMRGLKYYSHAAFENQLQAINSQRKYQISSQQEVIDFYAELDQKEKEYSFLRKILISYLQKTYPQRFQVYYTSEEPGQLMNMIHHAKRFDPKPGNLIINYNKEKRSYGSIGYFLSENQVTFYPLIYLFCWNNFKIPFSLKRFLKEFLLERSDYIELYLIRSEFVKQSQKFTLPAAQMGTISYITDQDPEYDKIIEYQDPSKVFNVDEDVPPLVED